MLTCDWMIVSSPISFSICDFLKIDLIHHDALSDARACAKLFLLTQTQMQLNF